MAVKDHLKSSSYCFPLPVQLSVKPTRCASTSARTHLTNYTAPWFPIPLPAAAPQGAVRLICNGFARLLRRVGNHVWDSRPALTCYPTETLAHVGFARFLEKRHPRLILKTADERENTPSSSSVFCFRFFLDFEFFFSFSSCCSKINCVTMKTKRANINFLAKTENKTLFSVVKSVLLHTVTAHTDRK